MPKPINKSLESLGFLPLCRRQSRRVPGSPPRLLPWAACLLAVILGGTTMAARGADYPNIVVIFCDDLGYGDLSCYGHPTIRTPQLDRMAAEGMLFTQFYSAAEVCTPSRAALLTGRLPPRNGMCSNRRRVLFPDSKGGLQADQITVAEVLKRRDYATACIGKWHLGHLPPYLPMEHGFDEFHGIPYSNDMDRVAESPAGREAFWEPRVEYWNVPLMRGGEIIERPADQTTITERYTRESIEFIRRNRERPFFLYLAHTMPHVPLFRSEPFVGQSDRGLYGDVIEEIDAGVGQILQTLRDEGLAENTLVLFTSDNGMNAFPDVEKIRYEGPDSKNPLAFRWYNGNEVVEGQDDEGALPLQRRLLAHVAGHRCRSVRCGHDAPALGRWHRLGRERLRNAPARLSSSSKSWGRAVLRFHDRDVAPEGPTLAETNKNLDAVVKVLRRNNSGPGSSCSGAPPICSATPATCTAPRPAATPTPSLRRRPGQEVPGSDQGTGRRRLRFWGGREGYQNLWNTDMKRELDHLARFLHMAVDYAKEIGFTGQF
jgi:hypothetical protein